MVHILTHNDLDGYAAGFVVLEHFGKENCDIVHLNYDKEPAIENFKQGDKVFITDYSLTNDQYRQIKELVGEDNLVWCDHHITAIKRYEEDENLFIDGIRSTKYCGAVLTWCYFNDIDTDEIDNCLSYDELMLRLPAYLRYVDAWDTWKLDSPYREDAEYLNISVGSRLSMELIAEMKDCLKDYIDTGKTYVEFRNQWSKQFREKYMFKKKMPGTNFGVNREIEMAVLNIGCANSTYFAEEIDNVDVCVTMCFNGKDWTVSLYSNKLDIDCSICAKMFGGGGHKGAAGCSFNQLTPPAFLLDKNEEILVVKEKK